MYKKLIIFSVLAVLFICGCARAPIKEALPAYKLQGLTYYPLDALCNYRGVGWEFDELSRTVRLSKAGHSISFFLFDNLLLIDGEPLEIRNITQLYQGKIVVPREFKESFDRIFKPADLAPPEYAKIKLKRVVLDPGHGGRDPGAISRSGLREKDVNLDVCRRLKELLKRSGVEVIMTRSSDEYISLSRRVDIANRSKADIFISVHSNANPSRRLNGFEVYYLAAGANNLSRAMNTARSVPLRMEGAALASNSLNLRAILWDMAYTSGSAESISMSRSICRIMDKELEAPFLGAKEARFQVLRGVRIPAVLIEIGFLSNQYEERLLRSSSYRQKVAEAVLGGITSYSQKAALLEVFKR
jgi:N-acetylmuramoyl-L-alanine amidase